MNYSNAKKATGEAVKEAARSMGFRHRLDSSGKDGDEWAFTYEISPSPDGDTGVFIMGDTEIGRPSFTIYTSDNDGRTRPHWSGRKPPSASQIVKATRRAKKAWFGSATPRRRDTARKIVIY